MKHAHPARVAQAPIGASEEERRGMLAGIIRWALNAAFALPVGWDIKLLESNGRGIEVYKQAIEHYDEEIATALCGSAVMLKGTVGFSNMDMFRVVQKDLIKTTAEAWDHTVNTQILPGFIASRWGVDALDNATTMQTDLTEPKDRAAEANTMVGLANGIKGLVEALKLAQAALGQTAKPLALNIVELLASYGIPVTQGAPIDIASIPAPGGDSPGAPTPPESTPPPAEEPPPAEQEEPGPANDADEEDEDDAA